MDDPPGPDSQEPPDPAVAPKADAAPAERPPDATAAPAADAPPPAPPAETAAATAPAPAGRSCGSVAAAGKGNGNGAIAVVGVRLPGQARVVQFNARGLDLDVGGRVVVEAEHGTEVGEVAQATTRARSMCGFGCMRGVVREATEEDVREAEERRRIEQEAIDYCGERIRGRRLPMKLVRVEPLSESRKVTFYFTAEGRVDFRELVKDLAARFKSRIEMRQIGARDEARVRGGYGDCGKTLCCSTFLKEFAPISIKMAKAQGLSLNPSKISGMCGRLKCCLRYEYEGPGGDREAPPEDEAPPPAAPEPADQAPPPA